MRLSFSLAACVVAGLAVGGYGCSTACSLIGCSSEGYELFFDPDSRWGEGVHTIEIYWSPADSDSISHFARCQIYPYFVGKNAECEDPSPNSAPIVVSDHSVLIRDFPDYVRVDIEDEGGWSTRYTIRDPEYDATTHPNGPKCSECKYGSTSVTLDGPGDLAGYVQDRYPGAEDNSSLGGAGGMGGAASSEGVIGSRCESNSHCALPGFCFEHFLGQAGICTQSCAANSDCPQGVVCAFDLIDDRFERIDGYCVRECADSATCAELGSQCNIQDAGHFCF